MMNRDQPQNQILLFFIIKLILIVQYIKTFKIYGLWINIIPEYAFDSSAANLITCAATFQYDFWSDGT